MTREDLLVFDLYLGTVAECETRDGYVPEGPMYMGLSRAGATLSAFRETVDSFISAGLLARGPVAHTLKTTERGRALAEKVRALLDKVRA